MEKLRDLDQVAGHGGQLPDQRVRQGAGREQQFGQHGGVQLGAMKHFLQPAARRGQPFQQPGRAISNAGVAQTEPAAQRGVEEPECHVFSGIGIVPKDFDAEDVGQTAARETAGQGVEQGFGRRMFLEATQPPV